MTSRLSTWFLKSRRFGTVPLFGTVTFCFELLDEEVCELDVVRSVCGLPSGSGKSDVSSSDNSTSSLFAVSRDF